VGGVACDVQQVSETGNEMTCITGAQPSSESSSFYGGRGIKFDVFLNQADVDSLDETGEKGKNK